MLINIITKPKEENKELKEIKEYEKDGVYITEYIYGVKNAS